MVKPWSLTAKEVADSFSSGELAIEDYLHSIFDRIKSVEEKIRSFVTVTEERAKRLARKKGRGRLWGIAIAVKDNICVKGIRTTCSSRMLENFVPPYNSTVVEKIEEEGGIIVGKTNMDEFAMGSSTETSYFGPTRNPWDLERVPGGSSGGSATAVIASEATLSLGSDTGGSIRCPASFCSVVGLKPTYGLVSRYGLIAYANSLEQIGPMARDVHGCALLLSVIAGHDPRDSTSVKIPRQDYTRFLVNDVKGVKIGVPKEFFGEGTEEGVSKVVWKAIEKLESLGAVCEETSLPSLDYSLAAYYLIAMAEASSNLARYDGVRYGYKIDDDTLGWSETFSKNRRIGFGAEVRRRILLGTYALSAGYYDRYYLKALKVRTVIRLDFEKAFKKYDVLIGPTMPVLPFLIGEKIEDPLSLYMCDVDTVPINLYGGPAISVPCAFVSGLPVGMQIMGKLFDEGTIIRVAYTFQENTDYHRRLPPIG